MVLVLSGHVFNPKRGVHGLVRETLSTVGGCASILKAGRPRKSGGRTTSARAGTSCISCFKFQRQISATCERNEPQCWLFILRCNTSWIDCPDFVHATLSAYDDRSPPQDALAKDPYR